MPLRPSRRELLGHQSGPQDCSSSSERATPRLRPFLRQHPTRRLHPPAQNSIQSQLAILRDDVSGAEAPDFDDSHWTTISTPHSFNDVDSFRKTISHSGGDLGTYKGLVLVSQALQASRRSLRPQDLP